MHVCVCILAFVTFKGSFFQNIRPCEDPLLVMEPKVQVPCGLGLGLSYEINEKMTRSQWKILVKMERHDVCVFPKYNVSVCRKSY